MRTAGPARWTRRLTVHPTRRTTSLSRWVPALVLALAPIPAHAQLEVQDFSAMLARSIGPAGMSGRVAAIDVVERDPRVVWVGSATGGVWKSTNGGLTFEPVFDEIAVSSIGAVSIHQANPDIVWVGTGEANPRNSMGVGRGVWRTVDGGRTWSFLGLADSERISRIALDPDDPDVAWVAALGPAWSDGAQRGVYRTTDGGATWQQVLAGDARTGAADLVMDPANPRKLIAAMWSYRRWPWFFESGGPGSGLFLTYDGGDTWTRLTAEHGLPAGELGRIGLAIPRSAPNVVYALVEAERSALLRSDDGGHTWRTVNASAGVNPRPFYYADIEADPVNENRLYRIAGSLDVSEDGGRTFRTVVPSSKIHGDVHALWLDPRDGQLVLQGNDGGVGISPDRGETWRFVANLPLAQYYHISVDMETPFHVYGGLQDNGSWVGPAWVYHSGGIRNYDFQRTGGGDGFASVVDARDPRFLFGQSQGGSLFRFDRVTGERMRAQPVHPDGTALRFNWNAALAVDPLQQGTVYFGSQFVHRSDDSGASWRVISPDLTTNDAAKQRQEESGGLTVDATGAENHTTIVTIAPSPVAAGTIWVGTDDGNVQLTRDGGATWTNVANRIVQASRRALAAAPAPASHRDARPLPEASNVPHIEASPFDANEAFVVYEDHQRGNWTPYLFHTSDGGQTWRALGTDGLDGFVHVIEQDPVERNLLFAGTEFGLFVSFDRGARWQRWTHGVPAVPVRALVVHPRDHDLVIATHGRAAFILDDIRPLRALAGRPALANAAVHIFDAPVAIQHEVAEPLGYRSTGDAMFFGANRPYGALLSFWIAGAAPRTDAAGGPRASGAQRASSARATTATIEILDAAGQLVRRMDHEATPGLNRVVWDLQTTGFRSPGQAERPDDGGPEVVPGDYTVRVQVGEQTATGRVTVTYDPRSTLTLADRRANFEEAQRLGALLERAAAAVDALRTAQDAVARTLTLTEGRNEQGVRDLRTQAQALRTRTEATLDRFVGRADDAVARTLRDAAGAVSGWLGAPTENHGVLARRAERALDAAIADVNALLDGDVARLRSAVNQAGLPLFPEIRRVGS